MFTFDLQLFAHKKGVSSTPTVATVNPNALALNATTVPLLKAVTSLFVSAVRTSIRALTLVSVKMTRCLHWFPVKLLSNVQVAITVR